MEEVKKKGIENNFALETIKIGQDRCKYYILLIQ